MKLKFFRVRNYKAIRDSGECELSTDNITILAGQNESGKTSILEALRDFHYPNEISDEATPDDNDEAKPSIECTFSIEKDELENLENVDGDRIECPDDVKKTLLRLGKITLRKTAPNICSIVEKDIVVAIEKCQALLDQPVAPVTKKEDEESDEEDSDEVKKSELKRKLYDELVDAFMTATPHFIYFDSVTLGEN